MDLQTGVHDLIPNDLADILLRRRNIDIDNLKKIYKHEDDKVTLNEYIHFLLNKRYAYKTKTKINVKQFPSLDLKYTSPSLIENSIIDIGENIYFENIYEFTRQLTVLGCKHLQIRVFFNHEIDKIIEVLKDIHKMPFNSIELLIQHDGISSYENYINSFKDFAKLKYTMIFGSHMDKYIESKKENNMGNIVFLKQRLSGCGMCGKISPDYFTVNSAFFRESLINNTCLNKKISLDINGDVKNCPSMRESHGNIQYVNIYNVIEKESFNKFWKISKDKVKVCNVCEFRNVCSDCRVYLNDQNDIYSKPLNCKYDPYNPFEFK
jgi:SPASM domain peptide maturase of grasp-with-spasm system